ncbi:chemotaxis protein CheA [Chitinibacteraceae bacterium HSL-7]
MTHEPGVSAFLEEAFDLLRHMERILLDAEQSQHDPECLNALFRAIHTIKGSAGLFALDDIVAFTHEVENVLDAVRSGRLTLTDSLAALLLRCHDTVLAMVVSLRDGAGADDPLERADLLAALAQIGGDDALPHVYSHEGEPQQPKREWLLYLGFGSDLLQMGIDPASMLRYLATQATIERVIPLWPALPADTRFDAERNYLHFAVRVSTALERDALADVFEFAREGSLIVLAPLDEAEPALALLTDEHRARVSEAWQRLGMVVGVRARKTGTTAAVASHLIKVEAEKLDGLINLIGELVINGAAGELLTRQSGHPALIEWSQSMLGLVEQVRTSALSMRMVQVGEIFNRFPRVVRDVSVELGKQIDLHITGADTELDKSMVDKLGDPLLHIVRNAIDHGIEPLAERLALGKPAQGCVQLNAYHESGSIVIEVADDGGGLDRPRILAKAVERSLVDATAELTEQEIYALIFEPGFSTAQSVTSLSGRGVGMDVVKQAIEALRGVITLHSTPQIGTVIRLRLPLTLAIIDGFMVRVADATFVIPLESVVECIELPDALRDEEGAGRLSLRGDLLPLLRLAPFLGLAADAECSRQNVVVVQLGEDKVGLVVDALLGEFQTVIKPLGLLFRHLRAIGGSTILGTGEVALILDVGELVRYAVQRDAERFSLQHDLEVYRGQ